MNISKILRYGRAIIPSIIFNFKYLPFKKAIKLPILVYKMKLLSWKGTVEIESENLHTGMIKLGFQQSLVFPNDGITWKNEGRVVFKGKCAIGNDCYIVVGKQGTLTFGHGFKVNAGLKLTAMCSISFGTQTWLGWGVVVMDTNHHPLYDMEKKRNKVAFSPIVIGDYNWIASQCCILHGVHTPERCIFGVRSVLSRNAPYESYCVHGGNPVHVLSRKVLLDYEDTFIKDYSWPQS